MSVRVLIVDPHPLFRRDLAHYLALLDGDYQIVGVAGSAHEARAILASQQLELLLIDTDLPDSNGFGAVRHIKQEWPAVAVVVLSNNAAPDYRQRALSAGAREYVDKLDLSLALPAALDLVRQELTRATVPVLRPQRLTACLPVSVAPQVMTADRPVRDHKATKPRERALPFQQQFAMLIAYLDRGPYNAWQCLHLLIAMACLQITLVFRAVQNQPSTTNALVLVSIIIALLGIATIEARRLVQIVADPRRQATG